ncbi:cytochrome p450 family 4 [Holotrichia oblita]|uniref:Cytochrome p450 family 4 n=1 Tax=Holotrichia oblita TaxID=644536 RepID=A0ACB9TGQ6_HOLOL|nr:cytochrome p450 family 4 [Holotrichia oblita]
MLFTIVTVLLIILILQFVYKQFRINKQLKGFVSPPASLISRHFHVFSSETELLPNLLDISSKYGGRVKLDVFHGTTVLLVTDKDLICHVLSTKPVLLKDALYDFGKKWVGEGIAMCKRYRRKKIKKEVDGKSKNGSLLDILLEAKIDDKLMTDEQIIDETQSFLFAGHDTSATTVGLILYTLSKHQDVQEKVVKEIESIFGSGNKYPTPADLNEMRYLDMVIKETMRYYTAVPFISRLIDHDISLGDIFIPKGISIILFLYGVHMNPEYFPNPEKFDPSRFEKEVTPYTFIPFGGGPRNCIGILPNLLSISNKYGGRVKLDYFYGMPILLITDKDLIGHILGTKSVLLKDAMYELMEKWLGDGVLTCKPDKWKTSRKMLNPAFSVQLLQTYVYSFENSVKILIEKLKSEVGNNGFNVLPYLSLCSLDIICETTMGIKLDAQRNKNSQYIEDIDEIGAIILRRLFSPIKRIPFTYKFTKDYQNELEVVARIRDFTRKVIDDRKKMKASTTINDSINNTDVKNKEYSLLDMLLEAEKDGRILTNEELIDEVQTFLFGGHDTSATSIALSLYCLSKHPDIQDKVVSELDLIFGTDNRYPIPNDLNEMRYLEMVIKETMRYYTPAPFISRMIDEDISFDDVFIPKGIPAMIFLYGVHMNPDYYPNPEKFDPSRFEKETIPYTFMPFGAGPRNCIGRRFASLEVKYIVAQILRNFKVLQVPSHLPQRTTAIVIRFKNGMMIRLEPR